MRFAHSTDIDKLLQAIEHHLSRVQQTLIMLVALLYAADDTSFHDPALFAPEGEAQAEGRERLFALIRMARDKGGELAGALDEAQMAVADRAAYFKRLIEADDLDAAVAEALDEATFVLESGGILPIVLLFDAHERESLGERPLARLVALQERALELLTTRTIKEAGEAHRAMSEALELAKLLAEGAEIRAWVDDGQEPGNEPTAVETRQEGEGEGEAGQGAAGEGTTGGEV